jgi:hypothetical protein
MLATRLHITAMSVVLLLPVLGLSASVNGQGRRTATAQSRESTLQHPLFTDYKAVRLGMTAAEARAKLGDPALKDKDQDYYVVSDNETVQIAYNPAGKIVTISIDYMGGVGAPEPKTVVNGELQLKPSGALYRMVRYDGEGYWVSYNRSPGPVIVVTITLQKI